MKRLISDTDKTKEDSSKLETLIKDLAADIRAINKDLGRYESSEQKQWNTIDALVKEASEIRLNVELLKRDRE